MHLSQKKELIIIAGSGKGIGFAIVQKLLTEFSNFQILAVSRNIEKLSVLKKKHKNLVAIKADLSQLDSSCKKEILKVAASYPLKGVIFTAGVLELKSIGKITKTDFDSTYSNNLWSFIDLIQTTYKYINKNTHIVSIGSMGGYTGTLKFNGMSTYSSSKAALSNFTECLAEELKEIGASANCLVIGAVETEMMKTAFPKYKTNITPNMMADFIIRFTLNDKNLFNGKVIPVSSTIP